MDTIRIKDKTFKRFILEEEINAAIETMAKRIGEDIKDKDPLFVCVLNGAFMFAAELMRKMDVTYEITFARYASYKGTCSTGQLNEIMPIQADIKDRTVILLEDIIDTGFTMQNVIKLLHERGVKDVKLATMLFKPDALKCDLKPDYVGLKIANDFIVGYGLDYDQEGRCLRDIYKIVSDN